MALLWMDSFDHYVTADLVEKYTSNAGASISAGNGRNATAALSGGSGLIKGLAPADATAIIGFAHRPTGTLGNNDVLMLGDGGFGNSTAQATVRILADGSITVYRGNSSVGTVLGTSAAGVVSSGVWQHIEAKITIHDSTGAVTIRVNGVAVLTLTGVDTKNTAAAQWTAFQVQPGSGNYIDDLFVCDGSGSNNNDLLGDCRVECLLPSTGNGSNTGLTPSTGTDHGALVDESAPNDDTDYNGATTTGVKDTYNFPSVATTGAVKGVQINLSAKKTDTGTKTICAVTRPGSTDYDGPTQALATTTYQYYSSIRETNPDTSALWTVSEINAAEFGMKVVA